MGFKYGRVCNITNPIIVMKYFVNDLYSLLTELTLTVGNIDMCLGDSVAPRMVPHLERELGVPPRDQRGLLLTGVKMWLLFDPTASWQKLAMALYVCTLDQALRRLKECKLLPSQGRNNNRLSHKTLYSSSCTDVVIVLDTCVDIVPSTNGGVVYTYNMAQTIALMKYMYRAITVSCIIMTLVWPCVAILQTT